MSQGRVYTVSIDRVAVSAAQDLFSVTAADDKPIEIVGLFIAQNTDYGDAQAENLAFNIVSGNTTVGSGGTAPTPRPVKGTDTAAGFTARINDTTQASAGTAITRHADGFNVQAGYTNWWPEGFEIDAKQGDFLCVRLPAAPADSITVSATLYVREMG
jgi:hypothetical protein